MIYSTLNIDIDNIPLNILLESIPPRNELMPLNCYHTLRISAVVSGRGIWTIGDKDFPISEGDVFSLNNTEYRKIHTIFPPENLELVILEFEPRLVWSNFSSYFDRNYLNVFFDRSPLFENRIEACNPIAGEISGLILKTGDEIRDALPECRQIIKANLLKILALLNRNYYGKGALTHLLNTAQGKYPSEINKVMEFIDAHISEDLPLNRLAELVHMNPSYFSRLFSKYNGLGVTRYIIKMRIRKAITLLTYGDNKSILEISGICGFNNLSNFYAAFKSVTGSTPTAYKSAAFPGSDSD
ncbi:MAG: helix-turn-helix domain-containing protein [Eubacteriales bacterium]|nr:helix-turn-helix domain-containing protein [Eubacteriales bacterium]